MRKLYHCTHCYFSFLCDTEPCQCIDCGKHTVREATRSETWDWFRYAVEERAVNLAEAFAYVHWTAS